LEINMAQLNTYVPVSDSGGKSHLFGPGDEIPEWAVALITNPEVWVAETEESAKAKADAEQAAAAAAAAAEADAAAAAKAKADAANKLSIPPKGGPKATADAWAAYAKQEIASRGLQIDIPADASRGDIIDALTSAEIPTEE
jgi:uncharacterized membrane protein